MCFQQFYLTFIVEFNLFSTYVFIASVQESRLFLIFFYIRRTRSMSRLTQLYPYFIILMYLYFNFYRQNQCVFQQFVSVFYRYIQCVFNNLIFILSPTSIYFQQFILLRYSVLLSHALILTIDVCLRKPPFVTFSFFSIP